MPRMKPKSVAALLIACGTVVGGAVVSVSAQLPGEPPTQRPGRLPPIDRREDPPLTPASPAGPATAPATLPSSADVRAQLPKLFADLANSDPAVRETARLSLMGVARPDLSAFEKVVRENLPLVPAQAAVLREIVTHAYLASDGYPATDREGFLGVRLLEVGVVSKQDDQEPPAEIEINPFDPRRPLTSGPPTTGVLIVERMPGFCGARSLQDGDVVLGIVERPGQPIRNPSEMRDAVTGFRAGETIHFQLLRQGQVIDVPITLDPRPEAADPLNAGLNAMQNLIDERKSRAAEYWEKTFAPMLKEAAG